MPFENRNPKNEPTRKLVLKAIKEFKEIGQQEFLKKYKSGYAPINRYLRHEGELYPINALWAASHVRPEQASKCNSNQAGYRFRAIGFGGSVRIDENGNEMSQFVYGSETQSKQTRQRASTVESAIEDDVWEGERLVKEIGVIKRNMRVVEAAKQKIGFNCQVCDFNFEDAYGDHGCDFIEAHHIEPLSVRQGKSKPTSVNDFAMLCANCHRMIHRRKEAISVENLRAIFEENKKKSALV